MKKYKVLNDEDNRLILAMADHGMKWQTAAKAIEMPINSAYWRLEKICRLTRLDPRDYYDLQKLVQIAKGSVADG